MSGFAGLDLLFSLPRPVHDHDTSLLLCTKMFRRPGVLTPAQPLAHALPQSSQSGEFRVIGVDSE